ncbi:hypothetical protein GH733_008355, partial [Mirounga leonina]
MFTGNQNPEDQTPEEQVFYEFIFRLFKENKVEIASAINKPFPLLMGLRDRGFISEHKYQHFQEACRNHVPVERVVYDVLSELEKTFDKTVLDVLFSNLNLKAYPDLLEICRSFQNVIYDNFHHEAIDEETKEMLHPQIPHELESCEPSPLRINNVRSLEETPSLLPNEGPVSCEHKALQRTNGGDFEEIPELLPGDGGVSCEQVVLQRDDGEESEEMPRLLPYDREVTCDPRVSPTTNEGKLEELPSLPAEEGQEHSNASWETSDEEEPQEALSSPPTCGQGRTQYCDFNLCLLLIFYKEKLRSCDPEAPQMITEEEPEEVLRQLLCDGEVSGKPETLQMNREEESEELISSLTYDGQGNYDLKNNKKQKQRLIKRNRQGRKKGDLKETPEMGRVNGRFQRKKQRRGDQEGYRKGDPWGKRKSSYITILAQALSYQHMEIRSVPVLCAPQKMCQKVQKQVLQVAKHVTRWILWILETTLLQENSRGREVR